MKSRIKTIFSTLTVILAMTALQRCQTPDNEIMQAVRNQLQLYPESTLQDIYKSFFQDEFGPGHLVENVSYAREYFDLELEEMASQGRHNAESCGTGKNFYRVPLDLVKDGKIPEEDYFTSFMESSSDFKIPDVETWKTKWGEIVNVIETMELDIKNYKDDKAALAEMLDDGETVVHHSKSFSEHYDPHYRIIGREQWEKLKGSILSY